MRRIFEFDKIDELTKEYEEIYLIYYVGSDVIDGFKILIYKNKEYCFDVIENSVKSSNKLIPGILIIRNSQEKYYKCWKPGIEEERYKKFIFPHHIEPFNIENFELYKLFDKFKDDETLNTQNISISAEDEQYELSLCQYNEKTLVRSWQELRCYGEDKTNDVLDEILNMATNHQFEYLEYDEENNEILGISYVDSKFFTSIIEFFYIDESAKLIRTIFYKDDMWYIEKELAPMIFDDPAPIQKEEVSKLFEEKILKKINGGLYYE